MFFDSVMQMYKIAQLTNLTSKNFPLQLFKQTSLVLVLVNKPNRGNLKEQTVFVLVPVMMKLRPRHSRASSEFPGVP